MASVPIGQSCVTIAGPTLLGCVRDQASASHPYASSDRLLTTPGATRNLADAIHCLCALHGRHPGAIELVAGRTVEPAARAWLNEAAEEFARERAYLARLAVEAGPIPPTPGTGTEGTLAMQRHAILTLAQSERRGCAIGAALAVAADWAAIRTVLDAAAVRFGVPMPPRWPAGMAAIEEVSETLTANPIVRRALLFGAEQVALQHRGLWDLLQARADARGS